MSNVKKEYTFFWTIENFSYCWHKNGEILVSPDFTIHKLEGTTWSLQLYPKGFDVESEGESYLFLCRNKKSCGPESVSVHFELSLLTADGEAFYCKKFYNAFKRGLGFGVDESLQLREILLEKRANSFSQDILTVCCKIWSGEGNVYNIGQSSARTRIRIERNSFLLVVEKFSSLQPNKKQAIKVPSSKNGLFILSCLYISEGLCCEKKIMLEVKPPECNQVLCKCEFSLLDATGNIIKCGKFDNRYNCVRESIHAMPLSLTMEELCRKKGEYLPNDKLSLICECTFSSGIEFSAIEEILNILPLAFINQKKSKNDYKSAKRLCINPSLSEDIKALYFDQCLTDVEVKTKTKSFPAHKAVLCARSPVFKAMLTNDMKEKNTDCIHIDDLENDVVEQLLLSLYSDSVENLCWETAFKLYYAADKYQIDTLKEACSSFLVENITTTNACELLLLADKHNNSNLMKLVQAFILRHEEQVFGSKEWDKVAETNPVLGMKTMQLKYKKKNEISKLNEIMKL